MEELVGQQSPGENNRTLRSLGWHAGFEQQLTPDDNAFLPVRVAAHFGSQLECLGEQADLSIPAQLLDVCGELAVGDWILVAPGTHRGIRRLERESLISRKAAGTKARTQLIAANVDTLFIVSSCNADFNPSRLERYLALASEAQVTPVVVLTKADLAEFPADYVSKATRLKSGIAVEVLDARSVADAEILSDWCREGQTVALVGSSGVGKSTLANALGADGVATQAIREDDAKGRHTTTARHLHQLQFGGLLLDTPGMRELQLADCEQGVEEVFDEIVELAQQCQFRDCTHQNEPGCAVGEALDRGELDERRLKSYRKLQSEQARNAMALHEQHDRSRRQGKLYKSIIASKKRSRGDQG